MPSLTFTSSKIQNSLLQVKCRCTSTLDLAQSPSISLNGITTCVNQNPCSSLNKTLFSACVLFLLETNFLLCLFYLRLFLLLSHTKMLSFSIVFAMIPAMILASPKIWHWYPLLMGLKIPQSQFMALIG